jgi:hypothetical protein
MSTHRVFRIRKREKQTRRLFGPVSRPTTFLILFFILFATVLYSASSASSSRATSPSRRPESAARGIDKSAKSTNRSAKTVPGTGSATASRSSLLPMLLPLPQEALEPETITTYAADCTTPKTVFNLGDEVCAKVSGGPSLTGIPRRFSWVNADNEIQSLAPVSVLPGTNKFTLTPPDGSGADWRGRWTVNSIGTRANLRATTTFFVKDADHPTVDLAVYDNINFETAGLSSETAAEYLVWVSNSGPNDATNVEVTTTGTNSSFISAEQQLGPNPGGFACTGSGANASCTIASLPAGATAQIRVVYQITPGAAVGTVITNTATISNDVEESRPDNNTYSASAVIRAVGDANACVLVCPGNRTVAANSTVSGQRGAIVTFDAETSGDCGTVTSSPQSGSFFPVGTTSVTISAGSDSCTFDITVTDGTPPTISCPNPVNKDAGSACSTELTEAEIGTPTASGGTGELTIVGVRDDGSPLDSPYPVGTTTITWKVTDEASLSASCNQLIIVTGAPDTVAPTITAPPDVEDGTGATGAACGKIVGESELGSPDTEDNCNSPVTIIRTGVPAGNFFPVGVTTVTYVAKDRAGNTSAPVTQKVTITENTPPSIKAPADESYTCLEQVPAPDPSKAQHDDMLDSNGNLIPPGPPTDNCSTPVVTVSDSATGAGTAANPRIITRTYTATDSSGNSASASQTITVIDSTLPTIALNGSSSVTVECHTSFTDPGATASDNCAGATVNVSGTVNIDAPGVYTLSYTATDAVGNTSAPVTRTVNVVDTTPPTVTLNGSSSMTVECHTSFTDPGATADDSCAGTLTVTTSGSVNVNVPGTYTVTYSAQDPSGNTASQTRTVVVVDTTPPVINLNGQNISFWPPNHGYRTVNVTDLVANVTDSCDTTLDINSVVISQVTSDETENGSGDGNTMNDIVVASGCKSVQLRAERNGSGNGRVYTITFKVKDASGNIGTVTAKVTVPKSSGGSAVDDGPHYTVNGCNP